jgi:lysozyme family protein
MKDNFEQCLAFVLREEGGFVNNPKDPGGATNHGITKKTWEAYTGKEATVEDIKNLTIEDVTPVYKTRYWDKIKGDDLPEGLDYAVFDFAVNSGNSRAAKYLQSCLGVVADGIIGDKTLEAVGLRSTRDLVTELCEKRLEYLQSLGTWQTFGKGWSARVARVEERAFHMV